MRDPAQFVRSHDRPLPASMLWLGAVALCVKGRVDWAAIEFHCVACEDPAQAAFAVGELNAFKNLVPLTPKLPVHLDMSTPPAHDFSGYAVLGLWNLEELRSMRVRAAKASISPPAPDFFDAAVSAIKGPSSPWLAMTVEDGKNVDRLIQARDAAHAAKIGLALPGKLSGLLPLIELATLTQKLEAGSICEPYSEAELMFHHRSAEEDEIELQEFTANNPRSKASQARLDAVINGLPIPPFADE